MSALAAARNTRQMADVARAPLPWLMKGATTVYQGSLVMLSGGYAVPGATATGKVAAGRAKKTVINAGADGALPIEVEEGIFKWANDGGDPVVAADMGATVYITDDQTVSHTATGKSAAGKAIQLDSDGVWVKTSV